VNITCSVTREVYITAKSGTGSAKRSTKKTRQTHSFPQIESVRASAEIASILSAKSGSTADSSLTHSESGWGDFNYED
jgi:hypothetical protein